MTTVLLAAAVLLAVPAGAALGPLVQRAITHHTHHRGGAR